MYRANSTHDLHCVALGWTHALSRSLGPMGSRLSCIKHVSTAFSSTEEETEVQRSLVSKVVEAGPELRPGSLGPSDVPHRTDNAGWRKQGKQ